MGDPAVIVTEADAAVERRRSKPNGAAFLSAFKHAPKAHVVPPIGALADRHFESQILPLILVIQMTDRRGVRSGRSSRTLPTISMLDRNVIGSAGSQPAASFAHRNASSREPTRPTLIGSAGIPVAVCVTIVSPARPFSMFVMPPRQRDEKIGQETVQHAADDQYKKQELGVPAGGLRHCKRSAGNVTNPCGSCNNGTRACPAKVAGSTGRCNTGVKSLRWSFECQSLTWPFVELTSDFVEMSLRIHRRVGPPREVLPQQTVGVFIGTALPRTFVDRRSKRRCWSLR